MSDTNITPEDVETEETLLKIIEIATPKVAVMVHEGREADLEKFYDGLIERIKALPFNQLMVLYLGTLDQSGRLLAKITAENLDKQD